MTNTTELQQLINQKAAKRLTDDTSNAADSLKKFLHGRNFAHTSIAYKNVSEKGKNRDLVTLNDVYLLLIIESKTCLEALYQDAETKQFLSDLETLKEKMASFGQELEDLTSEVDGMAQ